MNKPDPWLPLRSHFLQVLGVFVAIGLANAPAGQAATFVVANTNDSGVGSLRQALTDANGTLAPDTIHFSIPGSGPHTISPASALPKVAAPVTIDGYSQPGSSANTLTEGDDAVLNIV